jgi:hypothetical protein
MGVLMENLHYDFFTNSTIMLNRVIFLINRQTGSSSGGLRHFISGTRQYVFGEGGSPFSRIVIYAWSELSLNKDYPLSETWHGLCCS